MRELILMFKGLFYVMNVSFLGELRKLFKLFLVFCGLDKEFG